MSATPTGVPVDRRVLTAGLGVTVALLAEVFAAHWPADGVPPRVADDPGVNWTACPECGHRYSADAPLCPTLALVWPLLTRRWCIATSNTGKVALAVHVDALPVIDRVRLPMPSVPMPQRRRPAAVKPEPSDVGLFDATPYLSRPAYSGRPTA